jgi:anti-sigma-K factor RskA
MNESIILPLDSGMCDPLSTRTHPSRQHCCAVDQRCGGLASALVPGKGFGSRWVVVVAAAAAVAVEVAVAVGVAVRKNTTPTVSNIPEASVSAKNRRDPNPP